MDGVGAEVSQKIRSAIKAKLMELGAYVDEELPDYIMVMVANKRSREQMEDDLQLFLGSNTAEFTNWLHQVLQKLQEVTVASMERKRKSSPNESENETSKKEKHKKSVERKKIKRNIEQTMEKECEMTSSSQTMNQDGENMKKQNIDDNEIPSGQLKANDTSVEPRKLLRKVSVSGKLNKITDDSKQDEKQNKKIILMQSDDEDEDFINIKADAEAEALLDAELPKEALETPTIAATTAEIKQVVQGVQLSERLGVKVGSSVLDRLGVRKVTTVSHDTKPPTLRVTDRLGDKITERVGMRKVNALTLESDSDEKFSIRQAPKIVERQNVAHIAPTTVSRPSKLVIVKSEAEPKTLRRHLVEEPTDKDQLPRKRPLLSRVVALHKEGVEKEEEEYDPANPAVGSVASVVRVKPRPKVPAALQANKNLILKAMAEAQKSVANAPKRVEPPERVDGLFTKKFRDSKGRDKIAITLPNRRMQPREKSPVKENPSDIERIVIPVKLEASRSISSVNLQQKIVIQVSSDKTHETTSTEISKFDEIVQDDTGDLDTKLPEVTSEIETEELKDEGFEEIQRLISYDIQDLELESEEQVQSSSEIPVSFSDVPRTESPQFVVTLDGLDPTIFNPKKKQKSPTIIANSANLETDFQNKDREEVDAQKSTAKRPASPILYVKTATTESPGKVSDGLKQKINERCKYWPACRSGDKCDYLHPTLSCKSFPNCKFGDKCLYIHPNCKFDASCTRRDCPFTHASPRIMTSVVSVPAPKPSQQICKFYPRCNNVSCRFLHPKMCRYGRFCNRKTECTYRHEEIPTADKLKWICPFRL